MERVKRAITVCVTTALLVAGVLWWWPLGPLGVIVAALYWPLAGVLAGLFLDLLWGAPEGTLHVLYFPWTLLAVVMALAHYLSPRFFFSRGTDTL